MPQIIPEYQQRTSVSGASLGPGPVTPSSTGLGEGLNDLASGAQALVKAQETVRERDAATWATKTLSDTQSSWMQQLEQRKLRAPAGAANFTPDLLKDYDAQANQVAQGAPTRQSKQFMTDRLLALREELQRNAMSFEAASRVQNNLNVAQDSIESASNELQNNPHLFTQRLAERNALFDSMSLTAEQRQQLKDKAKSEMAYNSVVGLIQMHPANMLATLRSGDSTDPAIRSLTPEQRVQAENHASQAITAQYVEEERQIRLAKQAEELRQKQTQNAFLQKMNDGQLDAKTILNSNLAPFGSGSKDEFLNMLRARDQKPKTDPATFNEIFARINLPDGTPGKITDANQLNPYLIDQRINFEDLGHLRAEVEGKGTAQGEAESKLKSGLIEVAKSTLTHSNPLIGIQDPQGDSNLQQFTSWFLNEYQRQRSAGKSAADLLSPDSPDYLGKRITAFVRSPQQIMQDVLKSATNAPGTNAIPRKAGESAEDYLKRTGKL